MQQQVLSTLRTPQRARTKRRALSSFNTPEGMFCPQSDGTYGSVNRTQERERRLRQMLRVARNRLQRYGYTRRGYRFASPHQKGGMRISDYHIEIKRILTLLGRHDEVAEMEMRRKTIWRWLSDPRYSTDD